MTQAPTQPNAQSQNIQLHFHGIQEHLLEVFKKLYLGVHYVTGADVKGDIAEFGTMSGMTARILSKALLDLDIYSPMKKRLHLFDSFKGFPDTNTAIDIDSPHVKAGVWREGSCQGVSVDQLSQICQQFIPPDRFSVYDGWFSDTMSQIQEGTKFALMHIDCDLYQSTIDVLDYAFKHEMVSEGCALFFDDWNCNRANPEFGERKAWAEMVDKYKIKSSDCGEYGWCGHKFFVHQYSV